MALSKKEESEQFSEKMNRLQALFNTIKGKTTDVKSRVRLILDPDNIQTSTRLNSSQVDFVSLSFFLAERFPEFVPLREYAEHFMKTNISLRGGGVENVIRLMGALGETKLLSNLGITKSAESE